MDRSHSGRLCTTGAEWVEKVSLHPLLKCLMTLSG